MFSSDDSFEFNSYSKLYLSFKNGLDYFFKNVEYSVKRKEIAIIIR